MKSYIILVDGIRDATVSLPETPLIGSRVRTPSYFSYIVRKVLYEDGNKSIFLEAKRTI